MNTRHVVAGIHGHLSRNLLVRRSVKHLKFEMIYITSKLQKKITFR
jgi:hypothetical protein